MKTYLKINVKIVRKTRTICRYRKQQYISCENDQY